MLNFLHEMSVDDRASSFDGTYVRVLHKGLWKAGRCVGYDVDYITVHLGGDENYDCPIEDIDLTMPDLGMLWWDGGLYYVCRKPERQWRRGLRARQLLVYSLKRDGSSRKIQVSGQLERHIANSFLGEHYSHECVLTRDFGRRGSLLFFRTVPVGEFLKDGSVKMHFSGIPKLEGLIYANS